MLSVKVQPLEKLSCQNDPTEEILQPVSRIVTFVDNIFVLVSCRALFHISASYNFRVAYSRDSI